MATYYIGADVDSKMTELAALDHRGVVRWRERVPTAIPKLVEVLEGKPGSKCMVIEEGPMADWLYRNLRSHVAQFVVSDPRRNKLICSDGDKDDRIDAGKLADLLRGGYLRQVHHPDSQDRVTLKQWVGLYHDRVREAVRQINKIRARCRMYGVRPPRGVLRNAAARAVWLRELSKHPLGGQLAMLFPGLDVVRKQVRQALGQMSRLSRGEGIVGYWQALAGVGPVRAITLLAYLDTPWRFGSPKRLWKYCGVGLVRKTSGSDRQGRPKPGQIQMAWAVNRRLKDAVMGSAASAIAAGGNVFADSYHGWVRQGMSVGNARHAVARKMLTVMWGMWKTNSQFRADQVRGV
ncbi:MAG: transposase [Planctomycetaceae bacterium]|nr:transposase [Planctomycetaceae bacterium]